MNKKLKICHFTSAHVDTDTRIFYRQCVGLAKLGYQIDLLTLNGESKIKEAVNIISLELKYKNIFHRSIKSTYIFYNFFKNSAYDIYQFHDPELIPLGLILRWFLKKKVVFDIHENFLEQIKRRQMNYLLKKTTILTAKALNYFSAKSFYILLAEKSYESNYNKKTTNYEIIYNYPDTNFFSKYRVSDRGDLKDIFYVGLISYDRNIINILDALKILKDRGHKFKFHCIGPLVDGIESEIHKLKFIDDLKNVVQFYGRMDLNEAYEISRNCKFGLAILKGTGNYKNSYPTKIFEYYSILMPVLASNFPLYNSVVNEIEGGENVNPESPKEIADKMEEMLVDNMKFDKYMMQIKNDLSRRFTWSKELEKLVNVYKKLNS